MLFSPNVTALVSSLIDAEIAEINLYIDLLKIFFPSDATQLQSVETSLTQCAKAAEQQLASALNPTTPAPTTTSTTPRSGR